MARRVLVVDDEKLIVKGIRFSLEQDGYEVTCAYDGEEAVQYAKQTEFDIILLDLMLPKLSGLECFCLKIRRPGHCTARIVDSPCRVVGHNPASTLS